MNEVYNKYTIPESYRYEWDSTIIKAATQASAHLTNYAMTLPNPTGEYVKMQMLGSLTVHRRKQRHERKVWQEMLTNDRRIYPVAFAATAALSDDDFLYKGGLPIDLTTLYDSLVDASATIPDRVFLGVVFDESLDNCIIAPPGDWSPYKNDGSDGVNLTIHNGQPGGILGTNYIGQTGTETKAFPIQPVIGTDVATSYSDYASDLAGFNFKKTNVIPVNYVKAGSGTPVDSGLTIEKIRAARLALQYRHGLNSSDEVCMAITPWQMDDLLSLEKLQNKDYGFETLRTGEINTFLGVRFLVTVDVPIVNVGGKWVRCCPMWKKSSAAFGVWQGLKNDTVKLDEYYDTWLVSVQMAYGAGRRKEEDIICIHCDEVGLAELPTA